MSPNFKRPRKILTPPAIKGFTPFGVCNSAIDDNPVMLLCEEYEALRLCDYDMMTHHQAAGTMGVSRPTFTRIYASVRQKIARAFSEGRQIVIEGGKVYFNTKWYHCTTCSCFFNNIDMSAQPEICSLCGSESILISSDELINGLENEIAGGDCCICPTCGYKVEHTPGHRCNHRYCPKCNSPLRYRGMRRSGRNIKY